MPRIFAEQEGTSTGDSAIKARYGSPIISHFVVGKEGSPPETWRNIDGYGSTYQSRREYALSVYRTLTPIPPLVLVG